jgi:hypothetical protein
LSWSELASRVKERFSAPVRSKSFRFLHLLKTGTIVPRTITSKANAIKNDTDQPLEVATGGVAAAAGVLAASEDELEVAAGGVAAAAGVLAVSEDELALTSGAVVAAAGVSDRLRGRAAGVLTVAAGVTTISAGGATAADGVTTVSKGGVAATAAGVRAFSATVLVVVATGAVAAAAGVAAVSAGVVAVTVGAAATAAQCSEIMFSSVTAKLLSAAVELAPLARCPMRVTSWPRC